MAGLEKRGVQPGALFCGLSSHHLQLFSCPLHGNSFTIFPAKQCFELLSNSSRFRCSMVGFLQFGVGRFKLLVSFFQFAVSGFEILRGLYEGAAKDLGLSSRHLQLFICSF